MTLQSFLPRFLLPLLLTTMSIKADALPEVINAGTGGHRASEVLYVMRRGVLDPRPDLVIVMVGTNDTINSKKAVTTEDYRRNLELIVDGVRKSGAKLMLATIPPCYEPHLLLRHKREFFAELSPNERIRETNAVIREVAEAHELPLADVYALFEEKGAVGLEFESFLRNKANSGSDDGVHPTAKGYEAIGGLMAETIRAHSLPTGRVVCLGDSITLGAGVDGEGTAEGETYPAALKRLLSNP